MVAIVVFGFSICVLVTQACSLCENSVSLTCDVYTFPYVCHSLVKRLS